MSKSLGIIAGRGAYPGLLARSARDQGVDRIFVVAFKKETDPVIDGLADDVEWMALGQFAALLNAFEKSGVKEVVMAGQITPTHLFRVRPDKAMLTLLSGLKEKNAHTIFGAIGDALRERGIDLLPASMYMESTMPEPGLLGSRKPSEQEQKDIDLGLQVAKTTSALDIGQTVVIKEGTILAVEAFEGTDQTILRAGELGGPGSVVVKVAKRGHDMRFDIPVIGERTLKMVKKAGATALAVEAGRTILLEREKLIAMADKMDLCFTAIETDGESLNAF